MASILKISDGTTTVDFLASAGTYRVTSWAPAVAGRRASALGGRGPYEDVVETMEIAVSGSTAAASIETLRRLLDQATRWSMGEPVAAVVLSFKPTSSSDELKATILGPAEPGEPMIELPPNIVNAVAVGVVEPVILRFRRTGVWLGATVTKKALGGQENPNPMEVSGLTGMDTESPYRLQLEALPSQNTVIHDSFLLITSGTNTTTAKRLEIVNTAIELENGQFDDVSETGTVLGKALRFTSGVANTIYGSGTYTLGVTTSSASRYAVFINYKTQSSTATFRIRAVAYGKSSSGLIYGPWVTIKPEASPEPRYANLGVLSTPGGVGFFFLQATCDTSTTPTLLFDTMAIIAMDSVSDRVIAFPYRDLAGYTTSFTSADFNIDHRLLTDSTPAAYFVLANPLYESYGGDISLWLGPGHTVVYATWLGTGGPSSGKWRATNSSGVVPSTYMEIVQTKAYLIPR